ncbi:MAG: chemotaxis protein CheW [Planctomycetota bacterium]
MDTSLQLVIFNLDALQLALPLSVVERVIHVVKVTPLPHAPEIVIGVINVHGRIIPVVNIRKRFRLPEREPRLHDQLMILQTSKISVAIMVDAVGSVVERQDQEVIMADKILPHIEYVKGAIKLENNIIFIHDIDTFLSLEEEKTLFNALGKV